MTLPLPTPTWQRSTRQAPATDSANDTIAALEAAIDELTGDQAWTYSTPTGSDATHPARVLTPPASSPMNGSLSVLIGIGGGGEPAAAEEMNGRAPAAGIIIGGVANTDYTVGANWHDANPFGVGADWTEFSQFGDKASLAHIEVAACAEAIWIGLRYSATLWLGGFFGAFIDPSDLGSADPTERILGVMTSGNTTGGGNNISGLLSSTDTYELSRAGGGNTESNFVISNPLGAGLIRVNCVKDSTTRTSTAVGSSTTLSGRPYFRAIYVTHNTSPYLRIGRLRGIYAYESANMGAVIQDSGLNDRGYVISGSDNGDQAWVLGNPPP